MIIILKRMLILECGCVGWIKVVEDRFNWPLALNMAFVVYSTMLLLSHIVQRRMVR
jgi:hypothetical protein